MLYIDSFNLVYFFPLVDHQFELNFKFISRFIVKESLSEFVINLSCIDVAQRQQINQMELIHKLFSMNKHLILNHNLSQLLNQSPFKELT